MIMFELSDLRERMLVQHSVVKRVDDTVQRIEDKVFEEPNDDDIPDHDGMPVERESDDNGEVDDGGDDAVTTRDSWTQVNTPIVMDKRLTVKLNAKQDLE